MKYEVKFTNQFKKDLKLAKKQNKDLDKLFEVVNILADGGSLDARYRDHALSPWNSFRVVQEIIPIQHPYMLRGSRKHSTASHFFITSFKSSQIAVQIVPLPLTFS